LAGRQFFGAIEKKRCTPLETPVTLQWGKYWHVSSKWHGKRRKTQRAIILFCKIPETTFGSKASVGRRRANRGYHCGAGGVASDANHKLRDRTRTAFETEAAMARGADRIAFFQPRH